MLRPYAAVGVTPLHLACGAADVLASLLRNPDSSDDRPSGQEGWLPAAAPWPAPDPAASYWDSMQKNLQSIRLSFGMAGM